MSTLTFTRPRPVYCVNEHEHRDRELAEAVAPGVFEFAGEARRARASSPTGSDADLPDDEEWRIDWVKFYYGLDLADAFRATGDTRLPRTPGSGSSRASCSRSRRTTTPATSPPAGS